MTGEGVDEPQENSETIEKVLDSRLGKKGGLCHWEADYFLYLSSEAQILCLNFDTMNFSAHLHLL
jgi:hypothetical protein